MEWFDQRISGGPVSAVAHQYSRPTTVFHVSEWTLPEVLDPSGCWCWWVWLVCALCTSAGTYRACIPYMWYKYVYLSRLASLAQRLVPVSIRVPFEWLMMKGCVKGSGRRSGGGVRGGGRRGFTIQCR